VDEYLNYFSTLLASKSTPSIGLTIVGKRFKPLTLHFVELLPSSGLWMF
jgi:hypothetical protein